MIILPKGHRLSKQHSIRIRDLAGEQYVQRAFCEFGDLIDVRDMVERFPTQTAQDAKSSTRAIETTGYLGW
jgi:hypothetical protein